MLQGRARLIRSGTSQEPCSQAVVAGTLAGLHRWTFGQQVGNIDGLPQASKARHAATVNSTWEDREELNNKGWRLIERFDPSVQL